MVDFIDEESAKGYAGYHDFYKYNQSFEEPTKKERERLRRYPPRLGTTCLAGDRKDAPCICGYHLSDELRMEIYRWRVNA